MEGANMNAYEAAFLKISLKIKTNEKEKTKKINLYSIHKLIQTTRAWYHINIRYGASKGNQSSQNSRMLDGFQWWSAKLHVWDPTVEKYQ